MDKNELREQAISILDENDSLFCDMVEELDSWCGFADGYRCYSMNELDDVFCGCKISEFVDNLCSSFDRAHKYFFVSWYGIDSLDDDKAVFYRDNTDSEEVLDNIVSALSAHKDSIYIADGYFSSCDMQFKDIVLALVA